MDPGLAAGVALPPGSVLAVLGGGPRGAHLAALLARAGIAPHILEPDAFAAERAREMLARAGLDLPVRADAGALAAVRLALEAETEPGAARAPALAALHGLLPAAVPLVLTAPEPGFAGLAALLRPGVGLAGLDLWLAQPPGPLAEVLLPPPGVADGSGAAAALARALGRAPVAVRGGRGVAARLAAATRGAALWLAVSGGVPAEIDAARIAAGWRIGPFEADDLTGLDLAVPAQPLPGAAGQVLPRMLAEGRLGKKAGVGWYRYPGGGGAVADPLIEDLLAEEARFAGHARREIAPQEACARLFAAEAAAAAHLLADGTVAGSGLIDRMSRHGCGFPAARGGIVSAARASAPALRADLDRFAADAPALWQVPGPVLDMLLAS